ncbi:hypothetical protein GCM10028805_51130 [Spirosoma harenae]
MKSTIILLVVSLSFIILVFSRPSINRFIQQQKQQEPNTETTKTDLHTRQQHIQIAESEIRNRLNEAGMRCEGIKEIETGCLWIAVEEYNKQDTNLVMTLERIAKGQLFDCLTIVDFKQNTITRTVNTQ